MTGRCRLIAIAASTGGVEALGRVIMRFPITIPPVVIVQHMPQGFTKIFAARLDSKFDIEIKEAEDGDVLKPGRVLVAPAGLHMSLVPRGGGLACHCFPGEKVNNVIPAADILFESVANMAGKNAIGVVLTGMGGDGSKGLLQMRNAGARTIGQDKETSAIYGMPKVAYEVGAVEFQLPLDEIPKKILSLI